MNGWPDTVSDGWRVVFPRLRRQTLGDNLCATNGGQLLSTDEDSFARWLLSRRGISLDHYRLTVIKRRIAACLRLTRTNTVADARRYLRANPQHIPGAISTLVMGVTSFFRDPQVFEALRQKIVPPLADTGRRLRIWSVGCSTGAEIYSMAILLDRLGILHRCELYGSDCRQDALTEAQLGIYASSFYPCLPRDGFTQYFEPVGGAGQSVQVHWQLRSSVTWRCEDVLAANAEAIEQESHSYDIILCRNLAIYLRPEPLSRLWKRLGRALRAGGTLVVGKAERPSVSPLRALQPCIYQKQTMGLLT